MNDITVICFGQTNKRFNVKNNLLGRERHVNLLWDSRRTCINVVKLFGIPSKSKT